MKFDVVHNQKNDTYRSEIELSDADLQSVYGGQRYQGYEGGLAIPIEVPVSALVNQIGLIPVNVDGANADSLPNGGYMGSRSSRGSSDDGD